jgi:glycosyltransferase involved in cell wall biosynthesis
MRILHTVQLYYPHLGGSEEVVKQISERLVQRGHEVTVATGYDPRRDFDSWNGVRVKQFKVSGNLVSGIEGEAESYQDFVLSGHFDVMMNYAAQIWSSDLLFPHLGRIRGPKVLVPCGYSSLYDSRFQEYFAQLPAYLREYDALVYMSPNYRDKKFGDQHGLSKGHIIPNGASEEELGQPPLGFRQRYGINTKYMLLCVANFYPSKGHKLVIEAFQGLGRKDTTLVIVGRVPDGQRRWFQLCYLACRSYHLTCRIKAWASRRIRILEDVPRPWVVSAFQEADLFVFGSEIECSPLVILEALASRTPFVSTDCGDVGDHAEFGEVVENPEAMARSINGLLNDDERRSILAHDGHAHWRRYHTWGAITDQYEQLYRELGAQLPGCCSQPEDAWRSGECSQVPDSGCC